MVRCQIWYTEAWSKVQYVENNVENQTATLRRRTGYSTEGMPVVDGTELVTKLELDTELDVGCECQELDKVLDIWFRWDLRLTNDLSYG